MTRWRGVSGQVPKSKQKAKKKVKLITSPKQKPGHKKAKKEKKVPEKRCWAFVASGGKPPLFSCFFFCLLAVKSRKRNAIWAKVALVAISAFRLTNAKCARILISALQTPGSAPFRAGSSPSVAPIPEYV